MRGAGIGVMVILVAGCDPTSDAGAPDQAVMIYPSGSMDKFTFRQRPNS